MTKERLAYLLTVSNALSATAAELKELDNWYESFGQDELLSTKLNAAAKLAMEQKMMARIDREMDKPVFRLNWKQYAAAAITLLCLSAGLFYYRTAQIKVNDRGAYISKNDIDPGGNKAILTLANGTQIDLNKKAAGLMAQQQDTRIVKTADGTLRYENGEGDKLPATQNSIAIPRGGQYQLVLADGSKVWINSQSTLKFPTAFNGASREVELTGEAYFEIAHNTRQPFLVHSGGQVVKVLGTHFNINSYAGSVWQATLLQGSVSVSNTANGNNAILSPGQQASVNANGISVSIVDTENSTAWKNGQFKFENTAITTVIQQLERWYDVDISYKGTTNKKFYGSISRTVKLSTVLNMLQTTSHLNYKIEGRSVRLEN
jgi:transmembrane sensor